MQRPCSALPALQAGLQAPCWIAKSAGGVGRGRRAWQLAGVAAPFESANVSPWPNPSCACSTASAVGDQSFVTPSHRSDCQFREPGRPTAPGALPARSPAAPASPSASNIYSSTHRAPLHAPPPPRPQELGVLSAAQALQTAGESSRAARAPAQPRKKRKMYEIEVRGRSERRGECPGAAPAAAAPVAPGGAAAPSACSWCWLLRVVRKPLLQETLAAPKQQHPAGLQGLAGSGQAPAQPRVQAAAPRLHPADRPPCPSPPLRRAQVEVRRSGRLRGAQPENYDEDRLFERIGIDRWVGAGQWTCVGAGRASGCAPGLCALLCTCCSPFHIPRRWGLPGRS